MRCNPRDTTLGYVCGPELSIIDQYWTIRASDWRLRHGSDP